MLNNDSEFEALDLLNIASFLAQVDNIMSNNEQNKYIHKIIKAISLEINKLHKENNIIIEQNKEIIKLLKEGGKNYGTY